MAYENLQHRRVFAQRHVQPGDALTLPEIFQVMQGAIRHIALANGFLLREITFLIDVHTHEGTIRAQIRT